jgi:hypothetical protein
MKLAEERSYIPELDRLVVKTIYDAEPAMREAEEARQRGGDYMGSKGQRMLKACVIPMEHILRVKEESGYDLLSPDPEQWRKALAYIQANHQVFMATDKKVFTGKQTPKWA